MIYKKAINDYVADEINLSGNVVEQNQVIPANGIVLVFDYKAPEGKKSCAYGIAYYAIEIIDLMNPEKFIDA
jgi:ribosomal protein S7